MVPYIIFIYFTVVYCVPLMNGAFKATLAKARRRDQVDPIEFEQALLERGGFRFPGHRFPPELWDMVLGYTRVIY